MAKKPTTGMEAQSEKMFQTNHQELPTEDIKNTLSNHSEALIIVADPESDHEGESKIAVFSKLLDQNGVLAPMLANILHNLLATSDGKQRGSVADKTAIGA